MATTNFSLIDLYSRFTSKGIQILTNQKHEITLDNKHDVSFIELLIHDGNEYFSIVNNATNLNESFWVTDDSHFVTITSADTQETDTQETDTQETDTQETDTQETDTQETDVDAILALSDKLSFDDLLTLIDKLGSKVVKRHKIEKKQQKKDRTEKTQTTEKKDRVSAKNFNYYELLKSWHNLPTDEIMANKLNGGYSSSVINEDKRVINVLMGTDKTIKISQEWSEYIVNYWYQNPDTTWTRLHYAFSKGGRKCNDIDLLCNYIIDNGVSKEDIELAIAAQ